MFYRTLLVFYYQKRIFVFTQVLSRVMEDVRRQEKRRKMREEINGEPKNDCLGRGQKKRG